MEISNDLITQFAKIAKIDTKNKDATTVRGTVHISEDRVYIRLDGAADNSMTPADTTVEVNEGDRVIAAVKDHTIVITGNKTNPSIGKVTAGKLSSEIEQTAEAITTTVSANYEDLNGKISDEATARANADTGLGNRITDAESKITQTASEIKSTVTANYEELDGKISDEATARANGDTSLGNRITSAESSFTQRADLIESTVAANYDTLDDKISDEATARANSDTSLGNRITSAESKITQTASEITSTVSANYKTLDTKISNEATARANADTTNYNDLNGKISDEAEARESGDNDLSSRITSAESSFTQRADQIQSTVTANYSTLDTKISNEATARANADTTNYNDLNGKISDEADARESGDNDLSDRITNATSTFTQRADKIEGTVTANYNTLDGKIGTVQSSLTQTANSISSRVSSLESDNAEFSEFKQTVEGFSFMGNGGTVKINGGDINLTGSITWADFDETAKILWVNEAVEGMQEELADTDAWVAAVEEKADNAQSTADSAYILAEEAKNAAGSLGLPSYIKSTYIDATTIKSPEIIGGSFYAVGSDPDADSTFTTMDENGFYLYSNASKADTNNKIYPKISLYCDNSSAYVNPMIILGSGESDTYQFHNRFVIEKSGFSVNMEYHFDYSYTSCGFTFNYDGTIYVDGELRGYTGVFPIGYIYLSWDSTSPSSLFGGDWERLPGALLFSTSSDSSIGGSGNRVTVAASSGMDTIMIAAWRRTG